jgi:uncharacterized membrane protein
MTPNDSWTVVTDPAWPWSAPGIGLPALILVAALLVTLTLWTYLGLRGASFQRVSTLLGLRLAALLVACLVVLRPSVAQRDELRVPSTLHIIADYSESMNIQDQHRGQSRWEYQRALLADCESVLQQLRDEQSITTVMHRFAGDVREYDPAGKADGKRTDFGEMLHSLYERYGNERHLRGLLVLSDGADNGTRYPPLSLATKWRTLPCPISTIGFGQTVTTGNQRDIALTGIVPDPSPVAIKGKLTVKGTVDAPGFVGHDVRVHLLLNDKEVVADTQKLTKTAGNEVKLVCDAPPTPGEIKVTLKIDPVPGETTALNNEISTYVTVTREGISVLYVEGKYRAWEPKFIGSALSQEPSIRLFEAVRLTDDPPPPSEADLFHFEKQHYDVIILGDITARRLSAGNPQILNTIKQQVGDNGAGLMMIGGYESFGNSDWQNTDIAKMLPVFLDAAQQIKEPVHMVPTPDGLRHYVLRLAEKEADNTAVWNQLPKLDGMTKLGAPKPGAFLLAQSSTGEPILVAHTYGTGRVLAFAGDTTWRWCRTPELRKAHDRFWRQIVLWLAKRDEAEGNILVLPDTRRLPAGGKLGFSLRLRGKGGVDLPQKDAHFDVTIIGPEQDETKVPTAREKGEERGTFWKTEVPGEYLMVARGWGTDVDGKPLDNLPPAKARFMVYQDDAETSRQAADHEFLTRLANAGGGKFYRPEELKQFLKQMTSAPVPQNKTKPRLWPDWRRGPPSKSVADQFSALTSSGILACLVLFVLLLSTEWFLRRRWGFV